MSIANRIRAARTSIGMTQQQLADAVGKTRGAVAQWESGEIEPRRYTLARVALATETNVKWLEFGADVSGEAISPSYPEIENLVAIEALQQRMHVARAKFEDRPAMKFALESLPELIGGEDYADLCELLGMTEWHREEIPTGADFARLVRERVFKLKHVREASRERHLERAQL